MAQDDPREMLNNFCFTRLFHLYEELPIKIREDERRKVQLCHERCPSQRDRSDPHDPGVCEGLPKSYAKPSRRVWKKMDKTPGALKPVISCKLFL